MSLKLPPPLPIQTVLGAIDVEARRTASRARTHTLAAVRRVLPARSGRLVKGTRGSVRRTATGYQIVIAPSKSVRYPNGVTAVQVARWVEGGTGEFGPKHQPIRPRRAHAFRLPSGWRTTTIRGQAAQHPYSRVQSSEEARVQGILADGAQGAARAVEHVLEAAL